jgi:hypothetical protein
LESSEYCAWPLFSSGIEREARQSETLKTGFKEGQVTVRTMLSFIPSGL